MTGSEFVAEVIEIGGSRGLVEDFVDDGEKVIQRANLVERRVRRIAQETASSGQQEGLFDDGQRDVSLAELEREAAIITGVTVGRVG